VTETCKKESSDATEHTKMKHVLNFKYGRHNDPPKLPQPGPKIDYIVPSPFPDVIKQ
jgi:hypothetical protein